ncbi:hypothetical protein CRE_17513 [Caenorhabditis remanei]|uniref:Uncharacterized protein n=1 Tax=Caenorhabditis remanei TaxID=31234 RepID=E3NBZ7_CAERE|nr:hypothetical protein CRE_17513 [Caenorhabditis remanei]
MDADMDIADKEFIKFFSKTASKVNCSVYRRDLIRAFIAEGGIDTHRRYVHNTKMTRMILGSEYSMEQKAKMFFVARVPMTDTEFLRKLEQDFTVKTSQKMIIGLYSKTDGKSIFEAVDSKQKRIRIGPSPSTPTTSGPVKRAASEPPIPSPEQKKMAMELHDSEETPTPEVSMVRPDPDTPELEILSVVPPTTISACRNLVIVNFLQRLQMTITGFHRHELGGLCKKIKEAIQLVGSSETVLLPFRIAEIMNMFMGMLKGQRCVGSLNGEFFISQWELVDILLERMEDCTSLEYFVEALKNKQMEVRMNEELIVSYLEVGEVFSNFVDYITDKC